MAIGIIVALGLNAIQLIRGINGTDSQRQIEPTAIADIRTELKAQTVTLGKLDREMGGVTNNVQAIARQMDTVQENHRADIEQIHHRLGGISRELAATTARVEGIEKREDRS